MVRENEEICPKCGKKLKYYDTVRRIMRSKRHVTKRIYISRMRCSGGNTYHRVIPEIIYPHKQYEAEIIRGVLDGFITSETLGYEDYPCELTMKNRITQIPPTSF